MRAGGTGRAGGGILRGRPPEGCRADCRSALRRDAGVRRRCGRTARPPGQRPRPGRLEGRLRQERAGRPADMGTPRRRPADAGLPGAALRVRADREVLRRLPPDAGVADAGRPRRQHRRAGSHRGGRRLAAGDPSPTARPGQRLHLPDRRGRVRRGAAALRHAAQTRRAVERLRSLQRRRHDRRTDQRRKPVEPDRLPPGGRADRASERGCGRRVPQHPIDAAAGPGGRR